MMATSGTPLRLLLTTWLCSRQGSVDGNYSPPAHENRRSRNHRQNIDLTAETGMTPEMSVEQFTSHYQPIPVHFGISIQVLRHCYDLLDLPVTGFSPELVV
jgi:hypothetical protein